MSTLAQERHLALASLPGVQQSRGASQGVIRWRWYLESATVTCRTATGGTSRLRRPPS